MQYILSIALFMILLMSCNNEAILEQTLIEKKLASLHLKEVPRDSLIGDYSFRLGYSGADLELKSDNTFVYDYGSCVKSEYSHGKWKQENGRIVFFSDSPILDDLEAESRDTSNLEDLANQSLSTYLYKPAPTEGTINIFAESSFDVFTSLNTRTFYYKNGQLIEITYILNGILEEELEERIYEKVIYQATK